MNDVMILRRGGGAKLFAAIGVTYPEGGACTCSGKNTGKTFAAKDGYTSWIFSIPEPDEWTVKVTATVNGTEQSREQTVTITKEMQFAAVTLAFYLQMIESGVEKVAFEAVDASAETSGGVLVVSSAAVGSGYGSYYYAVDLSDYTSLSFDGLTSGSTNEYARVYVGTETDAAVPSEYSVILGYERSEYEIDVSQLTGVHYIVISPYRIMYDEDNALYREANAGIYNMRIE